MSKIKVSVIFGNEPKFNSNAFKYFILSLNKISITYEFSFPDIANNYPFSKEGCEYETANVVVEDFVNQHPIQGDFYVAIISTPFDNGYFFRSEGSNAVLTSDVWEKKFSPPSLFEYFMHSMICCLI